MAANTPSKFGPKTPQNSNVQMPGNSDGLASILGAALFGNSGLQNPDKLASEGKKQGSLVENIEALVVGSKKAIEMGSKFQDSVVELKTTVTQSSESLKSITQFQESNNKLLQALILTTAHELEILIERTNISAEILSKMDGGIGEMNKTVSNSLSSINDIKSDFAKIKQQPQGIDLTPIANVLSSIENKLPQDIDLTPLTNVLSSIENKLPQDIDLTPLTNVLSSIENKLPQGIDLTPLTNVLSSIENKLPTFDNEAIAGKLDNIFNNQLQLTDIQEIFSDTLNFSNDVLEIGIGKLNNTLETAVKDIPKIVDHLHNIRSYSGDTFDVINNKPQSSVDLTAITSAIQAVENKLSTLDNEQTKIKLQDLFNVAVKTNADTSNILSGVELVLDAILHLHKTQDKGATGDDSDAVKGIIDIIVNGADKDVIESLKALSEVKITDDNLLSVEQIENFKTYFERLNEVFVLTSTLGASAKDSLKVNKTINNAIQKHIELKDNLKGSFVVTNEDTANIEAFKGYFTKLDELFKTQVAVGKTAEQAVAANKQTDKAIKSSHKTAVTANENIDDIKEGTVSLSDLGNFLFKAGITLMIGALFMMIPGILEKCLMFTAALALFVTGILLPLQLISLINKNSAEFINSVGSLKSLIVSCGFLMMLGALFMMIPGITQHALMFGVTLSLFITTLMIPFAIIGAINSGKAFEGINNVKTLVMTAAVAMILGALVMSLGGGKYVKSALQFGVVLSTFILLLLLPVTLYATLVKDGIKGISDVNKLVVTATIVMMIGALFVMLGGGKFIKNALVFGLLLSAFIGLVLLPITIYSMLVFRANKTLNNITKLIVVCTIIMMVGALFTMNRALVVHALAFGFLLATFMTLVLSPIIMFSFLGKRAMRSLKSFTVMVIVCTIIMMIGALFIQDWKRVVFALAFTLLLATFISSVMFAIGFFSKKYPEAMKDMGMFALVIGVAGGVLMLGALVMSKYGWEALAFAALLSAFIFLTMKALDLGAKNNKRIGAGAFAFKQIGIAIGFISVAIGLLAIIGAEYGWDNVILGAGTLLACTFVLMKMFGVLGKGIPNIGKGTIGATLMGVGLIMLAAAIGTMAIIGKSFGWGNVIAGSITLMVVTVTFCALFALLGVAATYVVPGALAAGVMSGGLMILSVAIGIMAAIGDAFGWKNVALGVVTLAATITAFLVIFGLLAAAIIPLGLGGVAAGLLGAGLTLLTIPISIMTAVGKNVGWDNVFIGVGALAATVTSFLIIFGILAAAIVPLGLGSIAAGLLGAGLTILVIPISVMAMIGAKYGWGNVLAGVGTLAATVTSFLIIFGILAAAIIPLGLGGVAAGLLGAGLTILVAPISIIAMIGSTYGWDNVWAGVGTLAAVVPIFGIIFSIMSGLLPLIILGTAAAVALSAGMLILSAAITAMVAIFTLNDPEQVKSTPFTILSFLGGMSLVFAALVPLGVLAIPAMLGIGLMSGVIMSLSGLILVMGVAIKHFRNGVEGFNVSSIGTVIKQFIDAAPSFSLKAWLSARKSLSRVQSLAYTMSNVTRIVAAAIQSVASLAIPTKWNADGEPIKFRQLTEKDFVAAGNSIRSIMITLSDAIITTYTNYPALFGKDAEHILYKVRRLALTQSFVLHVLCSGLQSYAQLLIPTKWNKEGEPVKFRPMTTTDFENAAIGISTVMTTIGQAINDTYNNFPDLFGWKSGWILNRVRALALSQSFILHVLSSGIKSYAQIMIPTKWNKEGIATEYRQMKPEEFAQAAQNIGAVLQTLSFAIMSIWNGEEYNVKVNGKDVKIGAAGKGLGWYTFLIPHIIDSLMPMGDLIASIAGGMASYAKLMIPTDWDRKGRPIKFQHMGPEHFLAAGENIAMIITSLAEAVQKGYDALKPNGVWATLFGPSPEEKIKALQPLGDLVSSLAEGLANYAALQIPTRWDKKGRPVGFRTMTSNDFKLASQNIADVILTLGAAISTSWGGGKITFSDGSGWTIGRGLKDLVDPDELKILIESYSEMGDMISSLASGLADYAALQIPIGWNNKGKATRFRTMTKNDFSLAAQNIADIILTLGAAISRSWGGGKVVFSDGSSWTIGRGLKELVDPEELKMLIESYSEMGDLISNIASGVQAYANLSVPRYGKGGKIVGATPMKPEDIANAGVNIVKVLMGVLVGNADPSNIDTNNVKAGLIGAYNLLKEHDLEDDFADIVEAFSETGDLISNIATGIADYADLKIATRWDKDGKPIKYRQLKDKDFEAAANNIATVLAITTKSVIWAWEGGTMTIGKNTFTGDGLSDTFDDAAMLGDILEQMSKVGNLLSSVAEGISKFAALQIPNKWNDQGNPIGYLKLTDNDFVKASQNIAKVMTTMFDSLIKVVNENPDYFEKDADVAFKDVVDSVSGVGNIIKNIADGINTFAKGGIPKYNSEGKIIGYDKLTDADIQLMTNNVSNIMIALTRAVIGAGILIDQYSSSEEFESAIDNVSKIGSLIKNIAEGIQAWADMKMPTGWNSDGSASGYKRIDDKDIEMAKSNIVMIISTLCNAMIEASNTVLSDGTLLSNFSDSDIIPNILAVTGDVTEVIKNIVDIVKNIGEMKVPTGWNSDGTVSGYAKIDENHIKEFAGTIQTLLTVIPQTINTVYQQNQTLFKDDFIKATNEIYNVIGNIDSLVSGLMALIKTYTDSGEDLNKFFNYTSKNESVNDIKVKIINDSYIIFSDLIKLANLLLKAKLGDTKAMTSDWSLFLGNISTLVNDLIYSVIEPVSENVELIQKIFIAGKNPAENFKIGILGDLATIFADIKYLSSVISGEATLKTLKTFNENNDTVSDALYNFSDIISSLVEYVVYNLIDNKSDIDTIAVLSTTTNDNIKLAAFESVYNIITDTQYLMKTISEFEEADVNSMLNNISKFGNIFDALIVNVVAKLVANQEYINSVVEDMDVNKDLKLKPINDISAIINDVYTIIGKISDDITILGLLKAFKFNTFSTNVTNFKNVFNTILSDVVLPIVRYNSQLTKFIQLQGASTVEEQLYKCAVFNDIYTVIDDVTTFNEKIRDLDYLKLKYADVIIKTSQDLHNVINNLYNHIIDPALNYHEKISLLYTTPGVREQGDVKFYTGVISDIYGVIKDVNDLVELVNTSVNEDISTFGEGLTVLGNGLMCVIQALNEYTYNEGFAKGTEQIDKFIKNTVNQIDIEKIDRLISLTTSLNNLADKTTNLDELTKAIAEDLTLSLEELTKRMDESKQVIQLSEQIQQKRYQIITKVVSEMRGIMNEPIEVVISVKDQGTNTNGSQTPSDNPSEKKTSTTDPPAGDKIGNPQDGQQGGKQGGQQGGQQGGKQGGKQGGRDTKSTAQTSSERTLNDLKNRLDTVEADVANLKSNTQGGLAR